ncbi:MAG: HigA family addiction module antidote protein [Prevotella sp.]|nr:HigA family addiction module antidote protein [Prevotella sp.]
MIEIAGVRPDMIANNVEPFEPTHPGDLLKDEIECRGISQRQLAAEMGVSYTVLNDIVNGKRAVNPKFALLCEAALGVPAHVLMGLQTDYDMLIVKRDKSFLKKLQGVKRVAAVF